MFICKKCHDEYAKEEFGCYYNFGEHSKQELADCQVCGKAGLAVLCRAARSLTERNENYWQDKGVQNA